MSHIAQSMSTFGKFERKSAIDTSKPSKGLDTCFRAGLDFWMPDLHNLDFTDRY
jgi:hypothetical protein